MPSPCVVPGCRSNYKATEGLISSFTFPKDTKRRELWVRKIHREGFSPSPYSVVYIIHFAENHIIRVDKFVSSTGENELIVPRKKLKLTDDAYPSIFPGQPSYLSESITFKETSEVKRQKLESRYDLQLNNFLEADLIRDINSLKTFNVSNGWLTKDIELGVCYYLLSEDIPCFVKFSCVIKEDFQVRVFYKTNEIDINTFKWIFGNEFKCDRYSKLENLLVALRNYSPKEVSQNDEISNLIKKIRKSCN